MSRISRKMEHVEHALTIQETNSHGLDDVKFVHHCIPETRLDEMKLDSRIGELKLSSPIFMNAMTGGAVETFEINRDLAMAAKQCGVPMAVGSQMSAIKNPEMEYTYRIVREMNPEGIILANLGSEATVDQAIQAIEMIDADAVQIHLNVMQELIMPEGDRNFKGNSARIQAIAREVKVPVIVKEVGFGVSREAAKRIEALGVVAIDVGGQGGTNFAAIENRRRKLPLDMLNNWGITTSCSLLEVVDAVKDVAIIGTGGIKNGLDAAKCIALGASAVGMAGFFLKQWSDGGIASVVQSVEEIHMEMKVIMTALGVDTIERLQQVPVVITGKTAEWCNARKIDLVALANRNPF